MATAPKKKTAAKSAATARKAAEAKKAAAAAADPAPAKAVPDGANLVVDMDAITWDEQIRAERKAEELGWDFGEMTQSEAGKLFTWAVLVSTYPDLTWDDVGAMQIRANSKELRDLLGEG